MNVSHHKFSKPYKRKLTIGKLVWTWRIVGTFVAIRSPDGCTTVKTDIFQLNGTTAEEWFTNHAGEYPSSIDFYLPSVGPGSIRGLIETYQKAQGKKPEKKA